MDFMSWEFGAFALSVLIAGAHLGAYIQRQIAAKRALLPNVRPKLWIGSVGRTGEITLQNRMEEDLYITRISANVPLMEQTYKRSENLTSNEIQYIEVERAKDVDWRIEAGKTSTEKFFFKNPTDSSFEVKLMLSSSHGTLRNKSLAIENWTTVSRV